jgi:hypothetical protein
VTAGAGLAQRLSAYRRSVFYKCLAHGKPFFLTSELLDGFRPGNKRRQIYCLAIQPRRNSDLYGRIRTCNRLNEVTVVCATGRKLDKSQRCFARE